MAGTRPARRDLAALLSTALERVGGAAEYALVSQRLKVEAWTKTETSHGELLVSGTKTHDVMPGQRSGG